MKRQSSWLINRTFLLRILLPVGLTLVLFLVSIYQIVIPRFEEIILDRKREMIRELTRSAWHIADEYRQRVAQGRMTDSEARQQTIAQIRHLRYGDARKDYFWITDYRPVMIVHPFRDDLNGRDLSDIKDSRGKKLFVEMVKTVQAHGSGYVDYTWQWKDDSTRIVPKLSYVEPYAPWGWIIGTGIYLEDVKAEIAGLERNIINISIVITVTISLLLLFIATQNLKSERKRLLAEHHLMETKDKYEALVEAATEGLLMVLDRKQFFCNKPLLAMLGYEEGESGTMALKDLFPTELCAVFDSGNAGEILAPGKYPVEARLRRKDGSEFEALLTSSPVNFYGKTGVVIIVKDISQHKQMANALYESREKFLALTNQLSMAVFRTDASEEMRYIEANSATLRILGYTGMDDLTANRFGERFSDPHAYQLMYRELFESGFIKNRIVVLKRKNDTPFTVSLSVALVRDSAGSPRFCDCILEDVSVYMQSEMDANALIAELQAPLAFFHQPIQPFVREIGCCALDETLDRAWSIMARINTRALFVTDSAGRYVGILTRDDARNWGESDGRFVYEAMRAPLLMANKSTSVYELLAMQLENALNHFGVKDENGVVCGIVSVEDIQQAQLHSYLFVINRLQYAESIAEVKHCQDTLLVHTRLLIGNGAGIQSITRSLSVISDAIVRKIIALCLEDMGPPPVKFVFLALGSEGRSEQTLVTDQDNAILYHDPSEGQGSEVGEYFIQLGKRVCDALDTVGYSFCKGNVMAKNPGWCQPLSQWKEYFSDWVNTANPQDLLDVNIFFDFRTVYGDDTLTESLRTHMFDITKGNNAFFLYLAQNALLIKSPSWQIKALDTIDSKLALLPIVDLARIHALKHKIRATNTLDRFMHLRDKDVFSVAGYKDITQAYSFLMTLRYRHQAELFAENAVPNNIIDTSVLTEIERNTLRRVLSQIEDFKSKLSLDFKGTL